MSDQDRPSPEQMLARLRLEEDVEQPSTSPGDGKLRIFLGAAPGVGKTYEMLVEASEQYQAGRDVVVGLVETYGRPNTEAQVSGLVVMPRKQVEYRGVILEEMDSEAIIARKPEIALVDELAHTNAPGSKHEKRYEDVLDLLHAGINVWTTMNVQHIESLHTTVETITGVAVRETVPDWIVDRADEVSLVDVSVEEIHRRMKEGNIYSSAQARMALQSFFRKGNLTALRELALRRTAENVDTALERYMADHAINDPWTASERIMVAVDHRPFGKDLIRRGWSLARGLKAPLLVVTVQPPSDQTTLEQQANLKANLELAEDLGAEIIRLQSEKIAASLATLARERHITQIVIGKSSRPRWRNIFSQSLPGQLADLITQDLHIVSPKAAGRATTPTTYE